MPARTRPTRSHAEIRLNLTALVDVTVLLLTFFMVVNQFASAERVDISSLSAHLQEVGAGESPVDGQRVAEIRQAIAEGRFQINPERIADGLLASVREMLAAKR